ILVGSPVSVAAALACHGRSRRRRGLVPRQPHCRRVGGVRPLPGLSESGEAGEERDCDDKEKAHENLPSYCWPPAPVGSYCPPWAAPYLSRLCRWLGGRPLVEGLRRCPLCMTALARSLRSVAQEHDLTGRGVRTLWAQGLRLRAWMFRSRATRRAAISIS